MGQKLDNATALYMHGIRDGNVRDAVTRYTGDRYTQHSTGVADGVDGFVEFFDEFIRRNPIRDIRIVRGIEDDQYVFVQAYQDINNGEAKWVTTDLFDTDENDKIVEHWDVISAVEETSVSGRSQLDGPTEIEDLDKTDANKQLVTSFLRDVLQDGNLDKIEQYVSADHYAQHNPQVADGIDGLRAFVAELDASGTEFRYKNVFKIIGQGNFVVSYSRVQIGNDDYAVFDIFRVENGLIVEHWDNMEVILPEDQWGNSGKF